MMKKEQTSKSSQVKVTARKHGGDDEYSWAVFVNGTLFVSGLGRSEVAYYKRVALKQHG